jgi:hypothetical protein
VTRMPVAKGANTPKANSRLNNAGSLNCDPSGWLLEEYKLLSAHYFHEDNYFQHSVATFSTLNSGLIAFYASDLMANTAAAHFVLPAIGVTLSIAWMISILRTRERRVYAENRIVEIESALHCSWSAIPIPILPLDIGTRSKWNDVGRSGLWGKLRLNWLRNIPASKLALLLPPTFFGIWVLLLLAT